MVKENKDNKKITLKDVSLTIKIPIIISWIGLSIYALLFVIGLLSIMIG